MVSERKFSIESLLLSIVTILVISLDIFFDSTYIDEIIGLVSLGYLFVLSCQGKLTKNENYCFLALLLFVLIGLFSNLLFGLVDSLFVVLVDVLANIKVYMSFFALYCIFRNKRIREDYLRICLPIAKTFLSVALFFGVISLFKDIGMSSAERFGIRTYVFIFKMAHQMTAVVYWALAVIFTAGSYKRNKVFFFFGVILLLMNLKGPAIICAVLMVVFKFYYKSNEKLDIKMVLCVGIIVLLLGSYQINNYLLAEGSPRSTFLKYGFITANTYFPLGSGFATFGSDMASRHYSLLYYQYGFNNMWGMNEVDGWFLSDTGWSMYIAQNGYFGTFLLLTFLVYMFTMQYKNKLSSTQKTLYTSIFLQYMIHFVGSAVLTSSSGMIGFWSLAILASSYGSCRKYRGLSHE